MAGTKHLVPKEQLKTSLLEQRAQRGPEMMVYMDYDPVVDIWIIRFDWSNKETVVHYINEYVGLIYYTDSLQIIGIQVENFASGLLTSHPEANRYIQTWRDISKKFDGFKALPAGDLPIAHLIDAIVTVTGTDFDEPIVELAAALHF